MKRLKSLITLDLRSLALFRIGLGICLLGDLCIRLLDLRAHYTDWGILPRAALLDRYSSPWLFSFHALFGNGFWEIALFAIQLFFALLLLLGIKTRLATFISWFFLISLQNRNPLILQGGDVLFRSLLFWGMFLPLGSRLSVDEALDSRAKPTLPQPFISIAGAALILQIALIYWFSAAFKTDPIWRTEGTAIYYALSIDQFTKPFGYFLLQFPELLRQLSLSVWYLEAFGPFLLLVPFAAFRTAAVFIFIGFHAGLALTMDLGPFPYFCMVAWIALLPPEFWNFLKKIWDKPERTRLKLYYDVDCGFCKKTVLIIKSFLLHPKTEIEPASSRKEIQAELVRHNSWVVEDHLGKLHFKFEALTYVLLKSRLGFLFILLKPNFIQKIGKAFYEYVASHRKQFSFLTRKLEFKDNTWKQIRYGNILVALSFLYALYWNITTLPNPPIRMTPYLSWIGDLTRLDQKWNMFSPYPLKEDGWYVIPGQLMDGTQVDLFKDGAPVNWEKPKRVALTYKTERWRKYMMNIWSAEEQGQRLFYGRYLCRNWNDVHEDEKLVKEFQIVFMKEFTPEPGKIPTVEKVDIWNHWCFDKPKEEKK